MNKQIIDKRISVIRKYIALTIAAALLVIIMLNVMVVHDDEVAVITRLGKSHKVIKNPGIYLLIPFIDSSNSISKKISETYIQPVQITTKDRREVYIEAYATWQLSDPVLFIYTNGGKQPSTIIDDYLSSAIPTSSSNFSYEEIKSPGNSGSNLETVLKKQIGDRAYQNGIIIKGVYIKSLYLSAKSEETVIERMKTDCEKIAASILADGEQESSQIKKAGDRDADLITKKAELAVTTNRAEADSLAAQIYAKSYGKDLEFYQFTKTLELYKAQLKDNTTIYFSADSPFAKYLVK